MILLIETSVKTCSIALADEHKCIAYQESTSDKFQHAELINVYILEVLANAKVAVNNLKAIALSGGPGSYTGLRIGTSTAKGLCYALNIPLIVIDTLQGMGEYFISQNPELKITENTLLFPMIDARRLEVFTQKLSGDGKSLDLVEALILDESTFKNTEGEIILFGDGADKLVGQVEFLNSKVKILSGFRPSAKGLISLAFEKYDKKEFADLAYFEPNYLKEFKVG